MIRKSLEGVEVRVIYDSWFTKQPGILQEFRKAGIKPSPFKVVLPKFTSRLNFKTQEIIVIDGQIGYVGGINCGPLHRRFEVGYLAHHVRIEGKGVQGCSRSSYDWFLSQTITRRYFPELVYGDISLKW